MYLECCSLQCLLEALCVPPCAARYLVVLLGYHVHSLGGAFGVVPCTPALGSLSVLLGVLLGALHSVGGLLVYLSTLHTRCP